MPDFTSLRRPSPIGRLPVPDTLAICCGQCRPHSRKPAHTAPSSLFIDEIDAVGSREDQGSARNRNYQQQVINAFLGEMNTLAREEGVIVIGACNHPATIDAAILLAGRFDIKIEMPLPDADSLLAVFQRHFPAWPDADLRDLGQRAVGSSAADVDAAIRQLRAGVRAHDRAVTIKDLQVIFSVQSDPSIDWSVAVHECGHAIVCAALETGVVRRIFLERTGGGFVQWDPDAKSGLMIDIEAILAQHMAGRAAEYLVLGNISSGAGGSAASDLAKATAMALAIHTQYGLGACGPVWIGDADKALLLDPTWRSGCANISRQQKLVPCMSLASTATCWRRWHDS